jgi:hypothetical protein
VDTEAPLTKGYFARRRWARVSLRKVLALFGLLIFIVTGASTLYALVITNQTNTNVVLSYGIWDDTSFDLTADLENATGPISWTTTNVPSNVSAVFTNASDTGATLTLYQINNGPNAGNYQMNVVATAQSGESTSTMIAITVQQRAFSIRGSFTANNKTYDRSNSATIATDSLTPGLIDVLDGDTVTLVPVVIFANANAGVGKTVSLSTSSTLTGAQAGNYYITLSGAPTTTATIAQQSVTITPPTFSKTYDSTTTATAMGTPTLNGILSGDSITISGSPTFTYTQDSVGTNIPVTPSLSYGLSGTTASNYLLTQPSLAGEITKRSLSITFAGVNKTYDGTATATFTVASDTRVVGDVLGTISATTSQFTQVGIGTGLTINISGISGDGADADNYTFPSNATATANVTARTLTIGGTLQVPSTRVYDGTSGATISNTGALTLVNAVSAELSNLSLTNIVAQYANKNVGTSKAVSITSATLSGSARFNYTVSLSGAPTATANITAKALAVTITATNKQYDGNATASVTYLDDRISGDLFTVSGTATFDSKAVGTSKTVTATGITISGTDAANYTHNTSTTTTANITLRTLTIGISGGGKTYDGNTSATVTYTDNRLSGDNITITGTATYATKAVGSTKTITATGISVSGTDAANYTYNTTATVTANISTRPLTIGITGGGKTYDRTTAATVTYTDNRISGDLLTVSGTATYADKTAAANKTITATGITVSGTDASNYSLQNTSATVTAAIAKRSLLVGITGGGKTYNANTSASVTYTDDRISGDLLTVSGTATYADKTAAANKTITATGITVSGTDSANYTPNTSATTTATISQRALTITGTFTSSNKFYDATTTATVTTPASPTLTTIQGTDSVSLTGTPSFAFSQAGIGITLSITTSGYSLAGADAANYTLTLPVLSANITARTITVSGTLSVASTKVYDGALTATFVNSGLLTLSNVPAGDSGNASKLALASPVAQYATKTVGTSKAVSLTSASLSGTSAANYSLSLTGAPTATANITARTLTVTATGVNKTYDGLTTATVTLASDQLGADTVTLAYTSATYATKIVEVNKTVSVSGISISGTDAGNYTANTTATTTANITQRSLTVTITASNKVYDAGTTVSVTYGSNKVATDALTITGTASFASKAAGTSRTVNATGISVTGTDAANYTANTTATTTANITAKPLVVTITATNKVYNGSTAASVTYADDRISGDSFTVSGTPTFDSATVGTGKTVTATSISLSGTDASNYTPNTSATTTANVTVRTLTVTISGGGKTYDASTTASVTYTSDKVAADTLTITGTATYADKSAATGKTITAIGIALSGASSNNYVLGNTTATTTASISTRTLTITGTFTASNRIYDGTTDATGNVSVPVSPGITPIQGADNVALTGTPVFTYTNANVGTAIPITGSGYSITGDDASNYTLTQLTLSSNITTRTVTIGGSLVVPSTKTYDSATSISITNTAALTLVNVASLDAGNATRLALTGLVAQYANKTVGDAKTVSLSSASITGTSVSNYVLSTAGAPTATANITLRTLNVTITATNKIYNALTVASVTYADNRVSGDQLTVSGTANFDSKNFGDAKTVTATGITLSGTDAANYSQNTTATTTANITRRSLTVTGTFTVANRQYDATTDATPQITLPVSAGLSDVQAGDDTTLSGTPTFTFAQATVGNGIGITTTGYSVIGADAANYVLTPPSFTANITQRPLTIGGTLGVTSTKAYNRLTAATITDTSLLTLVNVPAGDANNAAKVALTSLTATYDNKNVGTGKIVSVATAALTGTTASNYTITTVGAPTTTADITQRPITLGFALSNKTYDGTMNASVSFTDTRISGDTLAVSGTPTYADKNVGTNKTVTATNMAISGVDSANYSYNTTATATASILARSLAVTITASSKTYDGNATASVVYADNRVSGDDITVSGVATFSNKNYGLSKTVTSNSISLSGVDASNYSPNTSTTTTANINRRTLTVTITASNKVYDRTTTATVTYNDNRVSGDILVITGTPTFSDKNVGDGKTVTASGISLSSTDAGNYTQNTTASTTANITKRPLTIGITPSSKVYNASDIAVVTYTDNRVSGDALTFSSTATFSDKNIGTSKTVTATGITVTNTDAGNYDHNTSTTSTANITKRPLTVTGTFTIANRQYDATTDATAQVTLPVSAGLSDVVAGDDAVLTGTPTFTFAQATVGTGIGISTTGYSVSGVDGNNYALTQPSFAANITQRPLTIGGALAVSSSKVYDKGVTATITDSAQLLLQNVPAGDANTPSKVALTSLAASYADKNVGTAKTVTLSTASLTGSTSTNYTLSIVGAPTTTADITRRSVTISITPTSKTYDGNDVASVTYGDARISGDTFSVSGTATFSDKNVGTVKTVTASGITLSGTDSGNYTPNSTATNTANITRRTLTVTTTGVNKVYDRTTAATVTFSDNRVSGDTFNYSATSAFANKTVGTGKTVSTSGITLSGTDSGNYTPNTTSSTTANITTRSLAVTITASNKVYDGNTSASVTYIDDRVSGDLFTVSGTSTFDNKNIGTTKTVTATGITISGSDAANYSQNTGTTTTANITIRTLNVTAVADTKMYDATVNATAVYSDDRVSGDVFTVTGTAAFTTKTAALGKPVSITNITITGTDAGNYQQNLTSTSTADIEQRPLEVTGTLQAQNKVYDGTRTASYDIADLTLVGVQGNDLVGVTNPRGRFRSDANVGVNKIVELTSFQFTGADLSNYAVSVNNSPITYATITPRTLNVSINASNKTYDGNTTASVVYTDNRVSGDVMTISGVPTFSDKEIGTSKTVTANSISLSGVASGNYSQNTTATATANITARSLTVTITASGKTYDGNTTASVAYADNRVSGDVFTVTGTPTFSTKTVASNKTVTASGISISGTDAGNYTYNTTATTTATITAKSLAVTITASDKVYDRTTTASVVYSDNRVSGDSLTVTGTPTFADKHVGTGKTVTAASIAISGTDAANYTQNTTATTTATITAKSLAVTITASNKVYNAAIAASVSYADNRINGDLFTVSGTATFDDKTAVNGKTVTATGIALSGADANNYAHNTTATTTANITKRNLTVTGTFTVANRPYDATTDATSQITLPASTGLSEVQVGDDTSLTGVPTFTFAQATVGTNIGISTSGYSLTGADADNYSLTSPTFTANITQRPLTIDGSLIVASTKMYDRTTSSTITDSSALSLLNVPVGDANTPSKVALAGLVAQYTNKTVATNKAVSLTSASLTGTTSLNYTLSLTGSPTTTADITRRTVNITITASNRTYDATDSVSVTYGDNRVSSDVFTVSGTPTFSDKNVGTGKTVTATGISLSGADANNYTPNTTATTTANITARTLTVTITASNKVYDSTTAATVVYADTRVAGDDFTVSGTATFTSKTVGTSKTVTASGISLSGTDAGNYTPNASATTTANITLRTLTLTATATDRTYDRTTNATVSISDDRVAGNALSITYTSSTFATKVVGVNKTVTVSGISVAGTDAANYSYPTTITTTATINQRTLSVTVTSTNKTYDSTDTAPVTYSDNRVSGDLFTVSGTSTFSDKIVGAGKIVTATSISLSGVDANNYTSNTTATTTANITARSLTVTITASNKVYDGATTASVTYSDNRINGDIFTVNGTSTFATKTVGTSKIVTASGISLSGTDAGNYTPNTSATSTANITIRTLALTASATDKTYDRSTSASVTISDDRVAGNALNISYSSATFESKTAGGSKTVTVGGISVAGTDAPNYTYATSITTTATINQRTLNVTTTPTNKVYDGTTTASVTYSDNRIAGDILTVSGEATYNSKTAVSGKTVTTSNMTITGTDAANYVLPSVTVNAASTANITPRPLTITGVFTVTNRQYDATTDATAQVTPPVSLGLSDVQLADDVALSGIPAFTFTQSIVGNGIEITTTGYSLIGADSSNYTLTLPTFTANITQRPLTIGGSLVTPSSRIYNKTTSASITTPNALTLVNVPSGDLNDAAKIALSSPVAAFADKNVGSEKTVSLTSASLSGSRVANYTLTLAGSPTATADITAKSLSVTIAATNKTYDALDTASVSYSDDRISGDMLTVSGTSAFDNKNVSNGKTVTASGITLSGTDAANYTPNTTATTTANITARSLTVTITADNKTYDRTTTANVTYVDNRISGDLFTISSTATFSDKNVSNGKTVTASGITLSGTDAANYTPNTTATTTANITARSLTVTITADNKVYDASEIASVIFADNRISGDLFTVSGTSSFSDKNVGIGKTVTATGISLSGTDAINYAHNTTATTTADITARSLTVTITADDKTYDATNTASVTYADNRISGDVITVNGAPTFSDKNMGAGKTVTAASISLSGADAGNYTPNTTTTTTANITARSLAVTITASNKTYDRSTNATVTYLDDRIAGDVFTVTGTPTFASKNVETNKTVTASGISLTGTDAANYTPNTSTTTTANITTKSLAVTITASNKTYDRSTNATVTYLDDRIAGDVLTITGNSTFSDKNVGTEKPVTASGIALSGIDASNYTSNNSATTTANITARNLAVIITASHKTYDQTNNATVTYSDNRVAGDTFTITGSPTFSDKNVGTEKSVTATAITLTGTDAANYTHNTTALTTANITARPLLVVPVANNKTYDATNIATVTYTDNRLSGDSFLVSSTALFDDAELGRNKPVNITGITLTGTDAGNYISSSTASSSGDITVRAITAGIQIPIHFVSLSDSTPSVVIGDLVPSIDTTVTFTRSGFPNVVCSLIPQNVTEVCTATTLADGTWSYRARQIIAGLMVAASEQLTITIDTTAPLATKTASFVDSSDTGTSSKDGITSDNTPSVFISDASDSDFVVVTASLNTQTLQCSFTATSTDRTCTLPTLLDGSWSITAIITDKAQNSSSPTPTLTAVIDTTAPDASAAPFNAQDDGASTSLDATPNISVAGVAAGDIATVTGVGPKGEDATCSFESSPAVTMCEMSTMTSGTWSMTSTVSDLAGNTSPVSPATSIIISAGKAPITISRSAVAPTPSVNRYENVVAVRFGTTAALAGVQSVSFIVLDGKGKVIRRATVKVDPEDTGARIVVPKSVKGAKVRIITNNQCGVSEGAPKSFNVRPGKTSLSVEKKTNIPALAGQLVLPQIDFAPSEITLDAADKALLNKALKDIRGKCGTLLVSGFSRHNNTNSKKYLQNLADFRAQAVADYLSGKGLTMWITYQGFVIKSNEKDASTNRRVSVYWTPA